MCILGAGGLIGRHLCKVFIDNEYQVTGLTRQSACPPELFGVIWFSCSQISTSTVLLDGAPWDVVIDLRAYHAQDLVDMTEYAREITAHWIHISTIYVYRQLSEALTFVDKEIFLPVPISEDTPCYPSGSYGIGKLECEKIWQKGHQYNGAPVTILRLPFVYGPFDQSLRTMYYIERLHARQTIYLPFAGDRRVDLLFVEDLAHVLIRLAGRPKSIGGVYNVTVRTALSLRTHIEILANLLGVPALTEPTEKAGRPIVPAPYAYPIDIVLDNSRLLNLLGNITIIPLQETWLKILK